MNDTWQSIIAKNHVRYAYTLGVRRGRRDAWQALGAVVWPCIIVGMILFTLWT